ncbi:hypothetical protein C8R46DRAFT_1048762 [Mycena filopes]|nr:hypothetical protein C8R46DRAFT_1048762 [Mycena filopes]
MRLRSFLVLLFAVPPSLSSLVDLTSSNRRSPVPGLPDWSRAGYEQGLKPLPDDSLVAKIITAAQLSSVYGVIANDGKDDSNGLQKAILDNPGDDDAFTLIQLPSGTLEISHPIYLSSNYLILRGAGNDPVDGTILTFNPDTNTQYDVLTSPDGDNWDIDGMSFSWSYEEPANTKSGTKLVTGSATSGWIWPGRSVFHVGSKAIAPKFTTPASLAPPNRIDLFYGSVNYHWRQVVIGSCFWLLKCIIGMTLFVYAKLTEHHIEKHSQSIKGYMADQTMEIAGFAGTRKVYIDTQNSSWGASSGTDIWIDYDSWQVQDKDYYQNEYMFQDWFTATGSGDDELGHFIELDHDLEFDVYTNSVTGGSPQMQGETYYTKIMPIEDPVHHVGIENLYITQPMPSLLVANGAKHSIPKSFVLLIHFCPATNNYGNMAPAQAMHGIVFRYARDSWIQNIRTYMTGSHPIATEAARHIQIQDNYFDGERTPNSRKVFFTHRLSFDQGAGGNGYVRGSRVWDSLYYNNTLRCAMRNVATMQNMTNDMNMHGGYEGHNLLELNYVSVPYAHRAGNCLDHCGGEGGSQEAGTWAPIYWSTGSKASKWSGATGPQNELYAQGAVLRSWGSDLDPDTLRHLPLVRTKWTISPDRGSPDGSRYQHLSNDGSNLLADWEGHEQDTFMDDPNSGVNGNLVGQYTSLFLRDVSNGTGITTFSSIAGYADCLGTVPPKVVGYYLGANPDNPPHTELKHGSASHGVVMLLTQQYLRIWDSHSGFISTSAVGGWGLGVDASPLVAIATSASARTKFGTSSLALLNSVGADGIGIEWTPCIGTTCISATQFSTIASAVKTGLGSKLLSLSTPNAFWSLAGVNTITKNLAQIVEFISMITHQKSPSANQDGNEIDVIQLTVAKARAAGMPPTIPLGNSTLQSTCLAPNDLGQGTYPYYAVDSILNDYTYDSDEYSDLSTDETSFADWLVLSDGSSMSSESPASVSARALLSQNLCMGGISVSTKIILFQILQMQSMPPEDFCRLQPRLFPENLANQLNTGFPFLNAQDSYRVLLSGALHIQLQLSNRLRLFLTESELSSDNFNLYKTWEGKAANYQLANITGTARSYWHCEGDGLPISNCPGSIIEDAGVTGSPHLTRFKTVQWFLDDADGFKQYLNDTVGINLDDLIESSFYVTRLDESCSPPVPPTGPNPDGPTKTLHSIGTSSSMSSSPAHSSIILGDHRSRHHSLYLKTSANHVLKRDTENPDPYDPPENCRTLWTGLHLVDPGTFFSNPADIIRSFVESSDNSVTQFTGLAGAIDVDPLTLISLLQTTLTTVSLANQTIANTKAYIEEVHHDEGLQEAFNQAHARESVAKVVANIGMILLNFIPGVGEIVDLVSGGVDTFSTISKIMDVASLAKTLDKDSDILKLLGSGLRTEDEVATAAEDVEDAMSVEAFTTRGKLGSSVSKVQDTSLQCASSSLKAWVMDTTQLGSALPPVLLRSRQGDRVALEDSQEMHPDHWIRKRAPKETCVFRTLKTANLKKSSKAYQTLCRLNDLPMEVPDNLQNPTSTVILSFTDCEALHKGRCQSDEWLNYMSAKLTKNDIKALCTALENQGINTKSQFVDVLNDRKSDNKAGGVFNPNAMKNQLMKAYNTVKSLDDAYTKYELQGRTLMYDVPNTHLITYSAARAEVATILDQALHSLHGTITSTGTSAQQKAMEKIYSPEKDGTLKPTMLKIIQEHEAHSASILASLRRDLPAASTQQNPNDPVADAADTDAQTRAKKKRAGPPPGGPCGNGSTKRRKVRT